MVKKKLVLRILSFLGAKASYVIKKVQYYSPGGYDSKRYWGDRFSKFRFDLRGAGHGSLTHRENLSMYNEAKRGFLGYIKKLGIVPSRSRVLEIGCGSGFYTNTMHERKVKEYTAIDITDAMLPSLKEKFPRFNFQQKDITEEEPEGMFDAIIMIDVTQHITNPGKFSRAMRHVRGHLKTRGYFIVTSWLDKHAKKAYYEVSRSLEDYKREFPGCTFFEPIPFRDKYLFGIRKN